jgi:hypothetical protein
MLKNLNKWYFFLPLVFLSIYIKCLCGYEYITTVMLSGISFLIIYCFQKTLSSKDRKKVVLAILAIGIFSLIGFFSALIVHAHIRCDSILDCLASIWNRDVLKRTVFGNTTNFNDNILQNTAKGLIEKSLKANLFIVFIKHIYYGGVWFFILLLASFVIVLYDIIIKNANYVMQSVMYFALFLVTISWVVLGKAHSFIHQPLNNVLWYFGFIQCAIYIIVKFIKEYHNHIIIKLKSIYGNN